MSKEIRNSIFNLCEGASGSSYWTPQNITAVVVSDTAINLTWSGGKIAKVERSTDGVVFTQIGTSTDNYSDTGLTPNTLYYYRVKGSAYSNVDSDTTLVIPVLDSYAGATGAYGLRKLRTAYAGNCILVRRSSDDAELAIGFLNGVLDDTALLTFCGAGDGFVKTWYDQSGNANNATQATAATQPQIVDSGVFIIEDGLKVIKFSGAQGLEANGVVSAINGTDLPLSVFSAISTGILTAGGSIPWSFGLSTSITPFYFLYDSQSANNIGGYSKRDNAGLIKSGGFILLNSKANLLTLVDKGTTLSIYSNGSAVIDTGVPVVDVDSNIGTITCDTFSIGYLRRTTTSAYFKGGANEIIIYGADKTADKVAIENNINTSLGNPFYV